MRFTGAMSNNIIQDYPFTSTNTVNTLDANTQNRNANTENVKNSNTQNNNYFGPTAQSGSNSTTLPTIPTIDVNNNNNNNTSFQPYTPYNPNYRGNYRGRGRGRSRGRGYRGNRGYRGYRGGYKRYQDRNTGYPVSGYRRQFKPPKYAYVQCRRCKMGGHYANKHDVMAQYYKPLMFEYAERFNKEIVENVTQRKQTNTVNTAVKDEENGTEFQPYQTN